MAALSKNTKDTVISALNVAHIHWEHRGPDYMALWATREEYAALSSLMKECGFYLIDEGYDLLTDKQIYIMWHG